MNPQELANVVNLLLDAAKLTESQKFEFIGRMNSSLLPAPPVQSLKAVVPAKPQVNPVVASGKVMIPNGHECKCDLCKAVVYRINRDVLENMPKKEFVDSFTPLGDAPVLLMPLDTWADADGNLAIDCPMCKGRKSLWIKGHGDVPFNDYPESTGPALNTQ